MKILMLTAALHSGGAETHICELARILALRGHSVCIASSGGNMVNLLSSYNVSHVTIPLNSKKPHLLFFSVLKLRSLLRKNDFDVIHIHSRIAAFVCRISLGIKPRACVVSTAHAHFRSGPFLRAFSFWGSASIAVSEDLKEHLIQKYGVFRENISIIPNAIDTDRFFSPAKKENAPRPPRMIFVSRLDTDCSLGALLLCRIAPRLAKKYPGVTIDIAGGGKAYRKIYAEAESVNKKLGYTCIRMLGHTDDIPSKLSDADLFVGVSRAALEAMSCELPVVLCGNEGFLGILDSSNISAAQNTNFCCRGCELPTSEGLMSAIYSILEMKPAERKALGKFLREYVCKNHGLSSLAEATESFYREHVFRTPVKRSNVLLCGYYGFGNLGDDALLSRAIERVRESEGSNSISVVCRAPKRIRERYGVRTIGRENFLAIARELKHAKKLVIGGGSVLQDASSSRSLKYYTSIMLYAAKKGVRIELLANGLGPFKRKRSKKRAAKALLLCKRLSFRDSTSASLALKLGCSADKIVLEDDLFSSVPHLSECETERLIARLGLKDKRPFDVIGIRGDTKRDELYKIKKEIEAHLKSGLFPVFIVMHQKKDKHLALRLAKRYKGIRIIPSSPSELISLASHAEFAIGNRYHLLYAAKHSGVPIVPFGDDPKIISLRYGKR